MPNRTMTHWNWSRNNFNIGEAPYTITLLEGGYTRWNGRWNNGWWDETGAFFHEPTNKSFICFIIEFAADMGPKRRHFFVKTALNKAVLLPPEHCVYTQNDVWHFKDSKVHANTTSIELHKYDKTKRFQ